MGQSWKSAGSAIVERKRKDAAFLMVQRAGKNPRFSLLAATKMQIFVYAEKKFQHFEQVTTQ